MDINEYNTVNEKLQELITEALKIKHERDQLKVALESIMPYLSLSTDVHCVTAVYRTPAQSLMEAAEAIMAKDKAIYQAREVLGMNPKSIVLNGNGILE
jgi:hypothetical protein